METQLKLGYRQHKQMKKLYGRYIGMQIALGRHMRNVINANYNDTNLVQHESDTNLCQKD